MNNKKGQIYYWRK